MSRTVYVDFKAVKATVTMLQILDHYNLTERFKRSGDNLSGPCPIHCGENPKHFRVSLQKNCWNCFGNCKHGGNILDFVAEKEGVSVRNAALLITEWFDLPTAEKPSEGEGSDSHPKSSAPANPKSEPASKESGVNKPLGFELKNLDPTHPYLAERGLTEETITEFGLGHCEKGSMADRIVIPIHNAEGSLVAYAGRWPGALPSDETPKYKFPPGFRKNLEVFNLHRAMREPSGAPLIVLEGFFGCLALWQLGIRRVVGLMGWSLSEQQEELLKRTVGSKDRVVLMLDENEAGREARLKLAPRLAAFSYVHIFRFPEEGQQPDSLKSEQLEEFRA